VAETDAFASEQEADAPCGNVLYLHTRFIAVFSGDLIEVADRAVLAHKRNKAVLLATWPASGSGADFGVEVPTACRMIRIQRI